MKRKRPNYWENRYNQWVIAGKIAVETRAINIYEPNGKLASIYKDNSNKIAYSVVGQDYLRMLNLEVKEL